MVHFSSLVMAFFLFLFSFSCITLTNASATKVVDVDTICKEVTNSSFCSSLIKSNPGGGADLLNLTQYTIDVVRTNVSNTINLINTLIAQSDNNMEAKYHYQRCLYYFGKDEGALHEVVDAQEYLKNGDYEGVNECAKGIMVYVEKCISGDDEGDSYSDTSLLPKYADVVENVAEIIFHISNYLVHV